MGGLGCRPVPRPPVRDCLGWRLRADPPPPTPYKRGWGGEGMFVQRWGWAGVGGVVGGQEAEFQSGFTLCYPFPAPPPHPRLHSRTRGGPAPGEIGLTGGSGYSLAAWCVGGGGGAGSRPFPARHSGWRVSQSTPSPPRDPPQPPLCGSQSPGGRGRSRKGAGLGGQDGPPPAHVQDPEMGFGSYLH